jgi:hypothetical protein
MKNYFLSLVLAVLVVLTGMTLRRSVASVTPTSGAQNNLTAIGGSPAPPIPQLVAIGGSPAPPIPQAIGGSPAPPIPQAIGGSPAPPIPQAIGGSPAPPIPQ